MTATLFCLVTLLFSFTQGEAQRFPSNGETKGSKDILNTTHIKISHDPKPETCCKRTSFSCSLKKITQCFITPRTDKCVAAIMFFSGNEGCCVSPAAPWVQKILKELEQKGKPCEDASKPEPNSTL